MPPPQAVKNQGEDSIRDEDSKDEDGGVGMVDLLHYLMECKVYIPSPRSRNRSIGWRNRGHVTMSLFPRNCKDSNRLPIPTISRL